MDIVRISLISCPGGESLRRGREASKVEGHGGRRLERSIKINLDASGEFRPINLDVRKQDRILHAQAMLCLAASAVKVTRCVLLKTVTIDLHTD